MADFLLVCFVFNFMVAYSSLDTHSPNTNFSFEYDTDDIIQIKQQISVR